MITAFMAVFTLVGICLLVQLVPSDKWDGDKRTYR
jgi:hypothetical protein